MPQNRLGYRRGQPLVPRVRSQIPEIGQKLARQLVRSVDIDTQRLQEPVDICCRGHGSSFAKRPSEIEEKTLMTEVS